MWFVVFVWRSSPPSSAGVQMFIKFSQSAAFEAQDQLFVVTLSADLFHFNLKLSPILLHNFIHLTL